MVAPRWLALPGLFLVLACEPQPDVGPRERSEPDLIVLGTCDALTDLLRTRIERDYDDRVLASAYGQMQSGLFGGGQYPIYVEDEYGPPYSIPPPHGPSPLVITDSDQVVILGESGVFIAAHNGTTLGDVRRVDLRVGDVPTRVWGGLHRSDGRVLVFSQAGVSLGDASDNPDIFDDKMSANASATLIDVLDVDTGELDLAARRTVSGRLLSAQMQNDTLRTVIRFAPLLPYLSTYPEAENASPVGGLADAVDATRAANRLLIDNIADAGLTPRWGSGLDPAAWTNAGPADCAAVRGAADSTGYAFALYTEWTLSNEASAYWAVVGEPAEALITDTSVLLVARAQGASWHLGTDLPLAANLHSVEGSGGDGSSKSHRTLGWPAAAQAPLALNAGRTLVVLTDGPRNETSYAYANASLAMLEPGATEPPLRRALGYPRSAPTTTLVAGDHIVSALDTLPSLWSRATGGPALVPEHTDAGRTWFIAPASPDRWIVLVDTADGATRVELRGRDHVALDTLTLQDAPEEASFFEGARAPLPPRELSGLAPPAYFPLYQTLTVPLFISDIDEDGFFRGENALLIIFVGADTMTLRARIVHRAPGFEGVGSDVPIRALDVSAAGHILAQSDRRVTLHDGVTATLLADRVLPLNTSDTTAP